MSRRKEISIGKLIVKDNQYVYEVTHWLMVYDAVLDRWNKTNKRVTYETVPEHDGVTKSLTFQAIIKKPMQNTFEPQNAFFLAKYIVKVPEEEKYTHYWLKKSNGHIVCSVLPSHSFILSLKHEFFTEVGKPKRISLEKAQALLKAKEASLVEKFGGSYQICTYNVRI